MIRRFTLALALLLAACGTNPALAVTPATPATLAAVIATARPGDVVQLAPGSYGPISISKRVFAPPLVITGKPGAVLKSVNITYSEGITFDQVTVNAGPAPSSNTIAFRVYQAKRILLSDAVLVGGKAVTGALPTATPPLPASAKGNVIGYPSGKGTSFVGCTNCAIIGSDVSLFHTGIDFGNSPGMIVEGNFVHDVRTSPIKGAPEANTSIIGNVTKCSTPWKYGGAGDHGDRLHIWADSGKIVTGLVITGNQFLEAGCGPIMGIFIQSKIIPPATTGGKYAGAIVSGNTVAQSNGQAIVFSGMTGGSVAADNILIWTQTNAGALTCLRGSVPCKTVPRLDIKSSRDLTVSGTRAFDAAMRPRAPVVTSVSAAMKAAGVVVLP